MRTIILLLVTVLFFFTGCKKNQKPHKVDQNAPFEKGRSVGVLEGGYLKEVSGIVASRRYPGYYWAHNDSGGEPAIYLIDSLGGKVAQVKIEGLKNRDWEDIAIGPGEKGKHSRLYIAETGDNRAIYGTYYIYSFEEPGVDLKNRTQRLFVDDYTTFTYQYPDGDRDAETLMVDPLTSDFYIVSKRERHVHVYVWPASKHTHTTFTLEKAGTIPFHEVVGGEISYNGTELLMKNYLSVFYWEREPGEAWADVLQKNPIVLPYHPEAQGEAIAFTHDGSAYVTLSEADNYTGIQHLYLYKRVAEKMKTITLN